MLKLIPLIVDAIAVIDRVLMGMLRQTRNGETDPEIRREMIETMNEVQETLKVLQTAIRNTLEERRPKGQLGRYGEGPEDSIKIGGTD